MKILVIDDTKSVHTLIKDSVKRSPSRPEILSAYNGLEGSEILDRAMVFEAVFLSWEVSKMRASDLLQKIMSLSPDTPVVVLTQEENPEHSMCIMHEGALDCLVKPFKAEHILEMLAKIAYVRSTTSRAA